MRPMGAEEALLTQDYREAVRTHLWYRGSRFSFHQGKTSKELADRYLRIAHEKLAEIGRKRRSA
jgi:hypothetical protein